jgi:hypothetical protein
MSRAKAGVEAENSVELLDQVVTKLDELLVRRKGHIGVLSILLGYPQRCGSAEMVSEEVIRNARA